jgi:hypothetical protein
MADKKQSTLALGTRQDAATWEKGCTGVGIGSLTSLRKSTPDMAELKSFFAETPDWLYFGGHFAGLTLFNEDRYNNRAGAVSIHFEDDHVEIKIDGTIERLNKADDTFQLYRNAVVILWGGCSVCDTTYTMKTLRNLFYPHVLLGFSGSTGVAMVDAMLGNGFIKTKHFFDNVSGKTADLDAVTKAWMTAAQTGYGSGPMADRFRAIDFDGQGWKLEGGKIKKWLKV